MTETPWVDRAGRPRAKHALLVRAALASALLISPCAILPSNRMSLTRYSEVALLQ